MNDMSPFRSANTSAAPAAPTGAAKLLPWARAAISGGFKIGLLMYVAQIALPHDYKPSVVFGQIAGDTERGDIEAKQGTVIDYERRRTDATEQARAKAQADVLVTQKVVEQASVSSDPLAMFAGTSDVACVAGQAVAAATANPTMRVVGDWRNGNVDSGWAGFFNQVAKAVAGVSCNLGTPLRETARAIQLDAAREAAAARGMSMTNGAVPIPLAPMQPPKAQPLAINLAQAPHRHFNNDQQRDLRLYAYGVPVDVLRVVVDGLDMTHGTPDAWYDRVAFYRESQHG
jgi:hypothetical protein